MECGVYYQEKGVASHQKSSRLKNKLYGVKFKNSFGNQNSMSSTKRNGVKENCDALVLNEPFLQSSQALCSPKSIIPLTNDKIKLEISNKEFLDFPEFSDLLQSLRNLLIHDNALRSLPRTVAEFQNLHFLNLSHNKLKELPSSLCELKNLEVLDLRCNELEDLPQTYSKLQRLKQLDISQNQFKSIPKCVETGMGTLKVFNISHNVHAKLNVIPYSKYIERFEAKCNQNCQKFPDWILSPKYFNFKECNLDKTNFNIYSFVGKEGSVAIQHFSMLFSNLSSPLLDVMIENMKNLEILNVGNEDNYDSGNILNSIPINIIRNPELIREINFRGTTIACIPNSINKLCNLKKLDIGMNSIMWLPEQFCELKNLEYLNIDGNSLILLPENIGNLKSLQKLRLENNSLSNLPKSFADLKSLVLLDLYNNVFEEAPSALLEMNNLEGLDLEQNYFATDNLKIGHKLYSSLKEHFRSDEKLYTESIFNSRRNSVKRKPIQNDYDEDKVFTLNISDSDEEYYKSPVSNRKKSTSDVEENWDCIIDSDDEFEPSNEEEVRSIQRSRMYMPKAQGFCPADLHSGRIKAEVASIRAYGSLPTYNEEEGQFDDA